MNHHCLVQKIPMGYVLELASTESATGYFSCRPSAPFSPEEMIAYLRQAPFDEFMHKMFLNTLSDLSRDARRVLFKNASQQNDRLLLAAFYEISLLQDETAAPEKKLKRLKRFKKIAPEDFLPYTPLIVIRAKTVADHALHRKWISLFRENIIGHKPLPLPRHCNLPFLYDPSELKEKFGTPTDIAAIYEKHAQTGNPSGNALPSPEQTAATALAILGETGILEGGEMRHEASLSPYALLRRWRMNLSVKNGRLDYRLSGIQTSYGRGLCLEYARASNVMEIAERYASFASFDGEFITGYKAGYNLIRSSFSSLRKQGIAALNPDAMSLEAPYADQTLYWMEAQTMARGEKKPILIPAQLVFPFCNLDEPALFSGLGTTGLASGNTLSQAKVSALLEVFERDAEATMPHIHSQCFTAESRDGPVAALLEAYERVGIGVAFQDLTSRFGVPCCKCFVQGPDGKIAKGAGAHLCAKKALLSAMTETPYPFPHGPESAPAPQSLLRVPLERLPDYATGNPDLDLAILEEILMKNNYQPIYIDLTRSDTGIPAVKAIVPGLEMMADFDEFSRVSPGLFFNYLKLCS